MLMIISLVNFLIFLLSYKLFHRAIWIAEDAAIEKILSSPKKSITILAPIIALELIRVLLEIQALGFEHFLQIFFALLGFLIRFGILCIIRLHYLEKERNSFLKSYFGLLLVQLIIYLPFWGFSGINFI